VVDGPEKPVCCGDGGEDERAANEVRDARQPEAVGQPAECDDKRAEVVGQRCADI